MGFSRLRRRVGSVAVVALVGASLLVGAGAGAAGVASAEPPVLRDGRLLSGPSPYDGCPAVADADLRGMTGEVAMAADPDRPRRVTAVWMQDLRGTNALGLEAATSGDGGRTWVAAGATATSVCTGGTASLVRDPSLAWGADGTLYLASVFASGEHQGQTGIQVSTSRDGGATWARPVPVVSDVLLLANADAPRIVTGPEPGSAYVTFFTARPGVQPAASTELYATTDGGRTWTRRAAPPVPPGTVFPALDLLSGPAGLVSVGVAVDAATLGAALAVLLGVPSTPVPAPDAPVVVSRSTDGGVSWGPADEVGRIAYPTHEVRDPDSGRFIDYLRADAAIDASGRLHVVWQQAVAGGSVVLHRRSANATTGFGPVTEVVRTRSAAFQPTLAVTEDGRPGLTLYDLDDDMPGDGQTTTSLRLYTRGGAPTWTRHTVLPPFDLSTSRHGEALFVGNQHPLVSSGAGFAFAATVAGDLADGQPDAVFAGHLRPPKE